ncbi:MAG: SurA N-terminal domain-containing protein [Prevotella sp.]|nr:SurA N-terminal domain-containing protein [Prevotella sp.]
MAALGSIRKRGVTLIIIVALGLFAFIAGDMVKGCEYFAGQKSQQVGEVLGKKMNILEYQELINEYQNVVKMTQQGRELTDQDRDQIWQQYVANELIAAEAEKLGLAVTDKEMQDILKDGSHPMLMNTPFVNPQTRRFDVTLLTQFQNELKNPQLDPQVAEQYQAYNNFWLFVEKSLRQSLLAEKYYSLLSHCLLSNPVSQKMYFDGTSIESTIQLASIAYSTVNDNDVKVTDADLKAEYDRRREQFRLYEETRDVKYVAFQVVASPADREELMKTMQTAVADFNAGTAAADVVRKAQSRISYLGLPVTKRAIGDMVIATRLDSMNVGQVSAPFESPYDNSLNVIKLIGKSQMPDSIEYRQIVVADASLEVARTKADSIYNALKGGADFEEIAKKYSQTGAKAWLVSNMYEGAQTLDADTKARLQALNSLGANELKNIELSQGNIIVQVTARRAMVEKYDLAIVKRTIDFSKTTYSEAYNKFSQYVSENQTVEGLEQNAQKFGYRLLTLDDMTSNSHNIGNVANSSKALKWAFEAEAGDVSPLFEVGNNDCLLVVALTKVHPVGYRTLEDVTEQLKPIVIRDKKFEQIAAKLQGVTSLAVAKAKGAVISDSISQVTALAPVSVPATGASEPAISGAVAATAQGQFCPKVIKGYEGAYMVQVLKKEPVAGAQFNAQSAADILKRRALTFVGLYMGELYRKANVVDRRYMF